ncbi:sulfatase family protein [Polaribacter sp. SA4-12]|uniref:sulfatase family protein n=1 Tax=Polaribacter sp. SA4-12 TaxID=1312072 RepID=UPI000B3D1DDA|nr:arylsulfatase [Polaribacter sp. SA4-12]ARV16597.1 arylsulfatase [Polaribacter sp. SA4-12]
MYKKQTILLFAILLTLLSCGNEKNINKVDNETSKKPNIIILYVDDLGYADVGCYGAVGVKTPNIDKMAKNGLLFTDAHSSAATCTPSRYSLLRGNYAFRKNAAVLQGDAPLLIDTTATTLPKILQKAGYTTGVVGKWHLGLGDGNINWNEKITLGPNQVGFDYSFLLPATGDRVPTVFMENGTVLNLSKEDPLSVSYDQKVGNRPTGIENPELRKQVADPQHNKTIVNGLSRIGYMGGGKSAEWIDEDFPFVFTKKAHQFIDENHKNPFFLFYSFHDIHVPRSPHNSFKGKSEMGPRGDAIVQVDYVVGEIIKKVEELGIADNTVIIFTSDNGPVLNDGYLDQAVELIGNHKPAGEFSGGKYSIYEGGTRVPTIAYWPKTILPSKSDALMNQVDLVASITAMTNQKLPEDVIDSQDHWNTWIGKSKKGRDSMLEEAYTFAYRDHKYKYIQPKTGNNYDWIKNDKGINAGISSEPQLFDLKIDKGEKNNLASKFPEKVKKYEAILQNIINNK